MRSGTTMGGENQIPCEKSTGTFTVGAQQVYQGTVSIELKVFTDYSDRYHAIVPSIRWFLNNTTSTQWQISISRHRHVGCEFDSTVYQCTHD